MKRLLFLFVIFIFSSTLSAQENGAYSIFNAKGKKVKYSKMIAQLPFLQKHIGMKLCANYTHNTRISVGTGTKVIPQKNTVDLLYLDGQSVKSYWLYFIDHFT